MNVQDWLTTLSKYPSDKEVKFEIYLPLGQMTLRLELVETKINEAGGPLFILQSTGE